MLKNYLKIAFRNLLRYKGYSFINISGLAIGIACCLLILLFVHDELSYDSFHENADRIVRINSDIKFGGNNMHIPQTSDMMGPILKKDYPQVEEFTRILSSGGTVVKKGNEFNNEPRAIFADSTFFSVFTFSAVAGDTKTALYGPNKVVITESMAKRYFGTVDVIGREIETQDNNGETYKITAVIKDMPENSHFKFDFIFSIKNANYKWGNYLSHYLYTYLLLQKGTDYKELESKLNQYIENYVLPVAKQFMHIQSMKEFEKQGNSLKYSLIPLTDIHLYSHRSYELSPNGNIQYVYIFSAIGLAILLIACINFVNLTTARTANRAKEVGIRKVLGTERKNLVFQFLTESILMAFLAMIIAVFIVDSLLPFLNSIADKKFYFRSLLSPVILQFLIFLPLIVGALAGTYPALYLSRFMPEQVLKGKLHTGSKRKGLRSILVVFQFATSVVLIIGTIIVYKQLSYMQNKELGYQKDQVLIINGTDALGKNVDAFKNEILRIPGVSCGTISGFIPVSSSLRNNLPFFKDQAMGSNSGMTMQSWYIDYDYLKTMGMKILEGRNFSKEFGSDSSAIIINETAAKLLGYEDPISQTIYSPVFQEPSLSAFNIIGIVKDFHYESLRHEIAPLSFVLMRNSSVVSFKVNASNASNILKQAKDIWKNMNPGNPFSYMFMEETFNEMYKNEKLVGETALTFTLLTIFIACLGLFGLASFLAEQKTKEIGVRKVMGASMSSILILLSKEFIKWILIANLIAWPIAYYFMKKWLLDFAYRIEIDVWVFIISFITAIIIALTTVSFQAIKAAIANPVKSLRYE